MGIDLFPKYKELTQECSELVGFSIEELCLVNPENRLFQTRYLQPTLFFLNMLGFYENQKLYGDPTFFLGHSLGEYSALCAAGAFSLQTGLQLVKKRALLMSEAKEGGMLAVLGLKKKEIQDILEQGSFSEIDIANYNTPTQFVLSGPKGRIEQLAKKLSEQGAKAIVLNVSGAFHSRYMQSAQREFSEFLASFSFEDPKVTVLSNATVEPYTKENMASLLSLQISQSVRWEESIIRLLSQGVETFHEVGSQILSKMVQEIRQEKTFTKEQKRNVFPLGSNAFKEFFRLQHAYVSGSMYRGIASPQLVIRMARAGFLSFYGTGGLELEEIERGISTIQQALPPDTPFGVNLLSNYMFPEEEMKLADLLLQKGIKVVEASAFLMITPALAYYAIKGLYYDSQKQQVANRHSIFTKVSHPQIAQMFLQPTPPHILETLLKEERITLEEAALAKNYPLSTCLCVEGDSGGHTNRKPLAPLFSSVAKVREEMQKIYKQPFFLGAAGGIGDPISVGMAFLMGADFVVTGSINQCTLEAGTSDRVKDLLQAMLPEDTDYSIAGDMFEMGAKVQVLKKGVLFPIRANTLYNLYTTFKNLQEISPSLRDLVEKQFFRISFEQAAQEMGDYYTQKKTGKEKMAALFRWYLRNSNAWAIQGDPDRISDYQIHTGPALGAFNQWVKNTPQEAWQKRHVDEIALLLLSAAGDYQKNLFAFHTGTGP